MSRDARDSEAGALFHRNFFGQRSDVIEGYDGKFRSRAERAIRLRSVTPHGAPQPLGGDARADLFDAARAIAVRDHARIGHADAERVPALLSVAGIDARSRDANANF